MTESILTPKERRFLKEGRERARRERLATRASLRAIGLYPSTWGTDVARRGRPGLVASTQAGIERLSAADLFAVMCIVGKLTKWEISPEEAANFASRMCLTGGGKK